MKKIVRKKMKINEVSIPPIKARDPNWKDMESLRKSGAAGAHRDKKKEMKQGKVKHKGKEMDESIYTHPAGNELSRIGRILMDKSITVKDDALSNVMGRLGDELTRYGEAGGASSFDELIKRVRLNKDQVMKMMKWAQKQEDTSLQKVKDPAPSADDEDEKEESVSNEKHDNMEFSDKEIKMAYGVLNDPRYKGGNYSGAVRTIEKIAKGLSDHPGVKKALQRTNEAICAECGKARFVAMPEEIQKQYESVNEEKQKGIDGKVCWKGYKRMGTKMKDGKRVDNCVKM